MKALIVEDEKILADIIADCIKKDFDYEIVYDGIDAIEYAKQGIYDIILLDLMIPGKNGYEVLETIRHLNILTPVLILTAKDSLEDKLKGFEIGADDYLTKPFAKEELKARVEALIRRNNKEFSKNELRFKDLVLDFNTRKVYYKDQELVFQGKQFDMLEYLLNSQDRIITKEQLFDKIWGFNSETTTNVVEVYASGVRKELKKCGYDKYLKTIRGVGYIFSKN